MNEEDFFLKQINKEVDNKYLRKEKKILKKRIEKIEKKIKNNIDWLKENRKEKKK